MPTVYERALEQRAALLRRDKDVAARLIDSYKTVEDDLLKRLKDVTDLIELRRANGEDVSLAWLYRQERYQAFLGQTRDKMADLAKMCGDQTVQAQKIAVSAAFSDSQELIHLGATEAGIHVDWLRQPQKAIDNLVSSLQPDAPLAKLLKSLKDEAIDKAKAALVNGVATGSSIPVITHNLRQTTGTSLSRALLIARTETLRSYRTASLQAYQESDIVEAWVWTSTLEEHTCFRAGTLIKTQHGAVPIESLRVGDSVLTHYGRYRRVLGTSARPYQGAMLTIEASGRQITCTANHPILVERGNQLHWLRADAVEIGDVVFVDAGQTDGAEQAAGHGVSDAAVIGRSNQPDDSITLADQESGFSSVSAFDLIVPIRFINLKHDVEIRQEEITRIAPAIDNVFLAERDTSRLQNLTRILFWLCFACIATIATNTTKAPRPRFAGRDTKDIRAVGAANLYRRAAASFRAIIAIGTTRGIKRSAAALADMSDGRGHLAGHRAKGLPAAVSAAIDIKRLAAASALQCAPCGGSAARIGAITSGFDVSALFVNGAAALAGMLNSWLRGSTIAAMRMQALICAVAGSAAKGVNGSRCVAARLGEFDAALGAGDDICAGDLPHERFRRAVVSNIDIHNQGCTETVYNLEIEDDHTYVAGGIVVHNCAACLALHNSIHPKDEPFASHPACRCCPRPLVAGGKVRGQSGEEWFEAQDAETKKAILGPKAYAEYKDGNVSLKDFVAYSHSRDYGASVRRASIPDAIAAHKGEAAVTRRLPVPAQSDTGERIRGKLDTANRLYEERLQPLRDRVTAAEAAADAASSSDQAAYDRSLLALASAQARLDAMTQAREDRLQALVSAPRPMQLTTTTGQGLGAIAADVAQSEASQFARYVSADVLTKGDVLFSPLRDSRSKYDMASGAVLVGKEIAARDPATKGDIAHEMGHWLEAQSPAVHQAALDFFDRRTAGYPLVSVRDHYQDDQYDPSEMMRIDQFPEPYMGKEYPGRATTEIISMGVQELYRDPAAFAAADADYFDFLIRTLQGR